MKNRKNPTRGEIDSGKVKMPPGSVDPVLTGNNDPSGISPGEISEIKPDIKEIPHSPHPPRRKKWKSYVYDFLMLFLAITAGFFVENQRELFLENVREKQYVRSLYDDLKVDTAVIQRVLQYKKWNGAKMDSLLAILGSPDIHLHNELIYYFERLLTVNDVFTTQDVTYQQLQSSGNFRYIGNKDLYKEISDYYNLYRRYSGLIEASVEDVAVLTEMESVLFHAGDLTSLYNPDSRNITTVFRRPERKFQPVKKDEYYLKFLFIKAANRRDIQVSSAIWLNWLKEKADKIIAELEREYQLD